MGFDPLDIIDPLGIRKLFSSDDDNKSKPQPAQPSQCHSTPQQSCDYLQDRSACSNGQDPNMAMLSCSINELVQTMQQFMMMMEGGFMGGGMPMGMGYPPAEPCGPPPGF